MRRDFMAGRTGLEPATSGLTGQRSNQLNYRPKRKETVNIKEVKKKNDKEQKLLKLWFAVSMSLPFYCF
jgi:hypothetical protein